MIAGALTTFSFTSSGGSGQGIAAYDFTVASGSADSMPHPSSSPGSLLASNWSSFGTAGSISFTPTSGGTGTVELTDFFSDTFSYEINFEIAGQSVPVPATFLLLLIGLLSYGVCRSVVRR